MAKYSSIKGFTVQTLSTDTIASQIAGGSWTAGGNLPGPRDECAGGGTLTAGIQFGGYDPPSAVYRAETFEYNGTAWTEGGNMTNDRSNFGGLGTQTAALAVGGQSPGVPTGLAKTEEYNGTSWSDGGDLPGYFVSNYGCTGTQTAGLNIGGTLHPNTKQVKTLSYNGTAWSDTGHDVPTAVDRNGTTGTSTAAMSGGGRAPSATNAFFTYNGSSWTAITNYPTSGYHFHVQGPYTDVIVSGGYPLNTNSTWWDGSSWTAAPNMSNNHGQAAHANSTAGATSGDGFVAGADPSGFNGTEHWNSAPATFNQIQEGQLYFNSTANAFKETITDIPGTSWVSGGNMNTDRWGNAGAGTLTSGLSINGQNPDSTNLVEEYNGSSWTEIAETNNSRSFGIGAGANAEAVLHFTGWGPPVTNTNELWNGSSWTETTDLNTSRYKACGAGTSTAAIAIAGTNASPPSSNRLTEVEVWDGSSWTEVAEVNTGGGDAASAGTSTDSIKAGTSNGPGTQVETWDGTSFTETTELNTGRYYLRGSGPSGQTDTLVFGGTPPYTGKTEKWNGSSWTELNDMSTARGAMASTNTTSASAWAAGGTTDGGTPGDTAATEEFEAGLANKTITAS